MNYGAQEAMIKKGTLTNYKMGTYLGMQKMGCERINNSILQCGKK